MTIPIAGMTERGLEHLFYQSLFKSLIPMTERKSRSFYVNRFLFEEPGPYDINLLDQKFLA